MVGRRQGLSPSPTLSAFGDEEGNAGAEEAEEEGGVSCRLLREEGSVPGDPVVAVGYTLITRSKAQTFRILNAELRCVLSFINYLMIRIWTLDPCSLKPHTTTS